MDKTEIERLKRAVLRDRKGATRPRVAFDRKLRAEILSHAQERLRGGERLVDIASSIGIKPLTLRHWTYGNETTSAKKPSASRFRAVRVVEAQPGGASGVTLFGPGGTRIDGLSLNQAAELLRRMS